jgi:predicted regulator of Ras-like GTPase activity (Roadblock/LC7/MglB family)
MHHALSDLRLINGVMGVFVFSPKSGVIACDVPGVVKRDKLSQAGRTISRIIGAGVSGFPELKDLVLTYSEMVLLIRVLKGGVVLTVMCDPALNINLLAMSLNLAQEDLDGLAEQPPEEPPTEEAESAAAAVEAKVAVTVESVKDDAALGPVFEQMRKALAKVIGPMASIIFDDSLEAWLAAHSPAPSCLSALAKIISKEIGDEAMAAKYMELIKDIKLS